MSVAEDLVAARALIDTPEKLERHGIVGAINVATADRLAARACIAALRGLDGFRDHPQVMAMFDRAIAAARAPHLSKGADHE